MERLSRENPWVWVVVQNPGGDEQIMGLRDQEKDAGFIPIFLTKQEANDCAADLPRERGSKYEIQAIRYRELARQAAGKGFMIYVLNGAGTICGKQNPV